MIFGLTAREITYNNFEISLVVFMPNITTNLLLPIQIPYPASRGFSLARLLAVADPGRGPAGASLLIFRPK